MLSSKTPSYTNDVVNPDPEINHPAIGVPPFQETTFFADAVICGNMWGLCKVDIQIDWISMVILSAMGTIGGAPKLAKLVQITPISYMIYGNYV